MLLICKPEQYDAIQAIFHRWGLDAAKIGEVVDKKNGEADMEGRNAHRD